MIEQFVTTLIAVLAYQCVGVALFLPLELAFPMQRIPFAERVRGFIFLMATALAGALVSAAKSGLAIEPAIHLRGSFGAPILASVALALWVDLQFYVVHRLEHRFLWRFHRVHHSIRTLSAANSYHHWTEPVWRMLVGGIPLLFVDVQIGPTLGWLGFVFLYQQFYIHSSARPHFGPLRWMLIDNRYHRVHHSLDPAHHHRNFGAMTPLWDWLFGTLYMPKSNEWPEVGLDNVAEPKSLHQWSAIPFLRHRESANLIGAPRSGRSEVLLDGDGATLPVRID